MSLLSVNVDITDYCNIMCEFCRVPPGKNFMGLEKFTRIVDTNESENFGIGGGEPPLHPLFADFIQLLMERNKKMVVSSNLTRKAEKFLEFPANQLALQVSLHASDKELYQRITGFDEYGTVIANIERVRHHQPTLIHCVVYKGNLGGVENLIDFSVRDLQLPIRVNLAYPVGNAKGLDVLSREEVISLTDLVSAKRVEYNHGKPMVISGLSFTDPDETGVNLPCPYNAASFGLAQGECSFKRAHYDVFGNRTICEFMEGK